MHTKKHVHGRERKPFHEYRCIRTPKTPYQVRPGHQMTSDHPDNLFQNLVETR